MGSGKYGNEPCSLAEQLLASQDGLCSVQLVGQAGYLNQCFLSFPSTF
jgi:hypothetical protein